MDLNPALVRRLQDDPGDDAAWLALADDLEERGDPRRAARVRDELRRGTPPEPGHFRTFRVSAAYVGLTGVPWAELAAEPFLRELSCSDVTVSGTDLAPLAGCRALEELRLDDCALDPAALEVLATLTNVARVSVQRDGAEDREFEGVHAARMVAFARLPAAERSRVARQWAARAGWLGRTDLRLGIAHRGVVPEWEWAYLRELGELTVLHLSVSGPADPVLGHLDKLRWLEELSVVAESVQSLGSVARVPSLRSLSLSAVHAGEALTDELASMRLERLTLEVGSLTFGSLVGATRGSSLRHLRLFGGDWQGTAAPPDFSRLYTVELLEDDVARQWAAANPDVAFFADGVLYVALEHFVQRTAGGWSLDVPRCLRHESSPEAGVFVWTIDTIDLYLDPPPMLTLAVRRRNSGALRAIADVTHFASAAHGDTDAELTADFPPGEQWDAAFERAARSLRPA